MHNVNISINCIGCHDWFKEKLNRISLKMYIKIKYIKMLIFSKKPVSKACMRNPCGGVNVSHLDSINVNILVVLLFYSCARCHHCGNQVKDSWDLFVLFLTTTWVSNDFKIKSLNFLKVLIFMLTDGYIGMPSV